MAAAAEAKAVKSLLGHVCFKGTSYEIEHEYLYGTWPTAVKGCKPVNGQLGPICKPGKLCGGFGLGS